MCYLGRSSESNIFTIENRDETVFLLSHNAIANISKIMYVGGSNLAGVSKRLRDHGFIVKTRDAEDERLTYLVITEKGRKALKNIETEKDRSLVYLLEDFSTNQKKELLGMLIRILKKDL